MWLSSIWTGRRALLHRARPLGRRPAVEQLEDRTVPSFLPPVSYSGASNLVAVGDFTNDGIQDLVATNAQDQLTVFPGKGDGTFAAPISSAPVEAPGFIATGDFNGDGKLDLVTVNLFNLSTYLGNGDGTFQAPQYFSLPNGQSTLFSYATGVQQLVVGDLNGDGKLDFVVGGFTSSATSQRIYIDVYLGNGDGTFTAQMPVPIVGTPAASVSFGLGDFNGDGRLDVLAATATSLPGPRVYLLTGIGNGRLSSPVTLSTNADAKLAVGDFNGDGKPDFVVPFYNYVYVYLGNGDGTFGALKKQTEGFDITGMLVGDFNRDGKLDLATSIYNSGDVGTLLGNGDGTFQKVQRFKVNRQWFSFAGADFNGDGYPDLAVTGISTLSNTVLVLLNDGQWPSGSALAPGPTARDAQGPNPNGLSESAPSNTLPDSRGSAPRTLRKSPSLRSGRPWPDQREGPLLRGAASGF
jgi:hypothetical protein